VWLSVLLVDGSVAIKRDDGMVGTLMIMPIQIILTI
jgi:hypothetical protein